MTGSQKFNHIVGQVVGSVLQFFGALYLLLALVMGGSVLVIGTYRVLVGWYTDYGRTFQGFFNIVTPIIGILFLVVVLVECFLSSMGKHTKRQIEKEKEETRPDDQ